MKLPFHSSISMVTFFYKAYDLAVKLVSRNSLLHLPKEKF